jgi:hypothetical protein
MAWWMKNCGGGCSPGVRRISGSVTWLPRGLIRTLAGSLTASASNG